MHHKLLLIAAVFYFLFSPYKSFSQAPDLGAAASFALFTAAGAFNGDAATSIVGDIGTNVGAYTPPGFHVGQVHLADPVSAQAAADVSTAYGYLASLTCGSVLATPLGNSQTLGPNIYCIGTAAVLNANLILDGGGNPGAIFIFQINGALSTNPFSSITLINGANLCNVYWQINGALNIGGSTSFVGTALVDGAINLANGASLLGRGLSTQGAISTMANTVTLPASCNCTLNISCPAPNGGAFQCISQIPPALPSNITVNSSCGATTTTFTNSATGSGCTSSPYVLTRTYTVTDAQGHTATCVRTYTAIDNTAPTITCPAGVTVPCASQVPAVNTAAVTTSDNCGAAPTVTFLGDAISNQSCANRYTITRTYRATDACGNTATCAQTITVFDNVAPAITCPTNATFQCAGQVPTASVASVTVGPDNCGGATPMVTFLGDVITNQTCANRYTITRTFQAADACGNSATCAQTITVFDNIAPVITCPANATFQCASQVPTASVASVTVGADNCGGAAPTVTFLGDVITNQTCANRYTITRTYRVTDACGNSATCAQTITVFDNTAPAIITCPAAVTVQCASLIPTVNTASVIPGVDNCGGTPTVTFIGDVITNQTCINRFTVTRTYRVTDVCGNSADCIQIITVFDNIAPIFVNPPANVSVGCEFVPSIPVLTATDNCSGPVTVTFLGEIQSPGICPIIFSLSRSWRAIDACGNTSNITQVVSVVETTTPDFILEPVNVLLECNLATNSDSLQNWINNHGGATVFDCTGITWTATNISTVEGCGGTFKRTFRFTATDLCGNSGFRDATFTVIDLTPPVFTVPPQNLEVACAQGDNGELALQLWLENFGYAQVSDACGSVVTTQTLFLSEKAQCGSTWSRIYQFRATDECGNTNYVTATFAVVDTTPPVIVKCPPGAFLTCADSVPGPDLAGVMATDNCGSVKIMATTYTSGTGCKNSPMTVSYWYMATDECGNMVSNCDQSFQIVDTIAPFYNGPDTIYVACVDDLPTPTQVMSLLMPYMVDNCYNFTCVGHVVGQNGPNSITYTMIAKDFCGSIANEFTVTFIATGTCKPICTATQNTWGNPAGTINGMATSAAADQLIGEYGAVKAGALNKVIMATSASCLQSMLPGAGNTAQFSAGNYTGNTCQSPSKFLNADGTLKNQLAANVMAMQLNLWYNLQFNDRDLGIQQLAVLPTCLVDPAVLAKMESGHLTVQGLIDLSNDYLAGVGFFDPNFGDLLYAALNNLNGYWENCQVNPPAPCPTSIDHATIAGTIKTETGFGLEGAAVDLSGSSPANQGYTMFNQSSQVGSYNFVDVIPLASDLTLTPTKNDNPLNGVSTYDLVLISRHILGLEPLNTPYKMIAADANSSGSITTLDIVELRKLILGIYQVLPDNTSWRFVDYSYQFSNPANPFASPFPENKTLTGIQSSQWDQDFVAVKIGDVNQSVIANTRQTTTDRTTGTFLLNVQDRKVQAGESFDLTFHAAEIVQGYQFTLNLSGLTCTQIVDSDKVNAENFGVFEDALTASLEGAQQFTLRFRAEKSGQLSGMLSMSSRITRAEAYTLAGERQEVALRFQDGVTGSTGFELYQNVPNPFNGTTVIGFNLPEAAEARLTLYDTTGKMVYTQHGDYYAGYNAITLAGDWLLQQGAGLYYYKLQTGANVSTRRMIQIK